MNERLETLMYESGITAQGCWDEMDEYDKQAIQRFAELIMQECIKVCNSRIGNADYNSGRMHCASDIRDHFQT